LNGLKGDYAAKMEKLSINDKIFLKHAGNLEYVKISEINLVTSLGNYCVVKMSDNKSIIVRGTLTNFEKILPDDNFIRVSRSAIVNLDRVSKIVRWSSGRYRVYLENFSEELIVSQRYAARIKKLAIF
jgi:DNA-binding LytR/AlgR family response regulator